MASTTSDTGDTSSKQQQAQCMRKENYNKSKAWFTIYARDGCEAARLRANSSEKVFTKHAGVFTKFSCLRVFATHRADHQGVRPLVYRRIYNTQVYQYGRKQNGAGMQKERSHWFFVFRPLLCLCFFSFLFFFFSQFLHVAIAAKIIENFDTCNISISK